MVWTPAYRAHVCAAIGDLADTKSHVDAVAARFAAADAPGARKEAFNVVSLAGQASGESARPRRGPRGTTSRRCIKTSADSLGQGASRWLDGLTSLDADVMGSGRRR